MSEPAAFVYLDVDGSCRPVGRLWIRAARGNQTASFEFEPTWIAEPLHYALGAALPPTAGPFHSGEGRAMFGALGDSAPDRWGRRLIARNEAHRARELGATPRAPREIDFLLGVTDIVRQGALRFRRTVEGPFVAEEGLGSIPPLIKLGELLEAAQLLSDDPESAEADSAARLLLAPGSSLGGARPKASVRDRDGALSIAKFPEKNDPTDVIRWERVMLALAQRVGIDVPAARVEMIGDTPVLLVRRFDRRGELRVPFLSAMSLIDAQDGETHSYVEIADALRRVASEATRGAAQLWRRMVFNILASNFDDHLRNHAVTYDGAGWRLSPAYDLNPVPALLTDRHLSTAINIDQDTTASIELALEAAREFFLSPKNARAIAAEVARGILDWRAEATRAGISARDVERMEPAFEHPDATLARRWA